jgi:hypothetical protein
MTEGKAILLKLRDALPVGAIIAKAGEPLVNNPALGRNAELRLKGQLHLRQGLRLFVPGTEAFLEVGKYFNVELGGHPNA